MSSHDDFVAAVRSYWDVRGIQGLTGRGEGASGTVRAGKHFEAVARLIERPFLEAGLGYQVLSGRAARLPGYFRVTKDWDLVVLDRGCLVAAFELKALGGPSFGNNLNNRVEEAVGSAQDVWRAYQEGSLGDLRPWLGYFFLIEDREGSRSTVAVSSTVGRSIPRWRGRATASGPRSCAPG